MGSKIEQLQQRGLNTPLAAPEGRTAQSAPVLAANDTGGRTWRKEGKECISQQSFHNLNDCHRGVTLDTNTRTKASGGQLQEDKIWLNMGTMKVCRQLSSIGTGTHVGCESSSLET